MSEPYLITLLQSGVIPHQRSGTGGRVPFEDLMVYKRSEDSKRERALQELTYLSQQCWLGY